MRSGHMSFGIRLRDQLFLAASVVLIHYLTGSFFYTKSCKVFPIRYPKPGGAIFSLLEKEHAGGGCTNPSPPLARVKMLGERCTRYFVLMCQ